MTSVKTPRSKGPLGQLAALRWGGLFALGLLAALSVVLIIRRDSPPVQGVALADGPKRPPPAIPVNRVRALSPAEAEAANEAISVSREPVEPASRFAFPQTATAELSRATALECLTAAIYYEAASEAAQGQRGVAQVVLNRVRHPSFPKSVCGVVYQGSERRTGCQFTFTCDGSLARQPSRDGWDRAAGVAAAALGGAVEPSVGTATHYHTVSVLPYWADSLTKIGTIGAHIFYRWPGYWGRRAAFTGVYRGEAQVAGVVVPSAFDSPVAERVPDPSSTILPPLPNLFADERASRLGSPNAPGGLVPIEDGRVGRLIVDDDAGAARLRADEP